MAQPIEVEMDDLEVLDLEMPLEVEVDIDNLTRWWNGWPHLETCSLIPYDFPGEYCIEIIPITSWA